MGLIGKKMGVKTNHGFEFGKKKDGYVSNGVSNLIGEKKRWGWRRTKDYNLVKKRWVWEKQCIRLYRKMEAETNNGLEFGKKKERFESNGVSDLIGERKKR